MTTMALLGSGEFEPWARAADGWCLERATVPGDRVLVLPTASAPEGDETFDRWGVKGLDHYRAMGLDPVVLPLKTREDAHDPSFVERLDGAKLIFFSGGNPGYLADTLRGTPFWVALTETVAGGAALGGCSAGAVVTGIMAPFVMNDTLSHWVDGLAMLPRAFVMPHFDALEMYEPGLRDRFIGSAPADSTPVGIDEDTALLGDGETWTVRGAGAVWVGHDLVPYRDGDRFELVLR